MTADARSEQAWLDAVRGSILRGQLDTAQRTLDAALTCFPRSADLRRAQAGVYQETAQPQAAERLLRRLLAERPDDIAAAFALVRTLRDQVRMAEAAAVLRRAFEVDGGTRDADLAIRAIELLDDIDRRRDADAIAEAALRKHPDDARLHAYAAMLAIQCGDFARARNHYRFAIGHDPRAFEWHVAIGLASTQRYDDAADPDFALFEGALRRDNLSALARAELHFALGKAHDDVGAYAQAADHFRQGNAIRQHDARWPAKAWRRLMAARLTATHAQITTAPTPGFTPVFIVGMPRTGTTLLAEWLSRRPQVCNRGELTTLARLAQRVDPSTRASAQVLRAAADDYVRAARQDDATNARWFIDKQPLNFRYLDLALALFPDTRVIHCVRSARDTALSLWMQCFLEREQDYAYAFNDIALVMQGEQRLMAHWKTLFPDAIESVRYEDFTTAPDATVARIAAWIGLAAATPGAAHGGTISTASLWQARQPVHTRSIGRARHYATLIPELARFPEVQQSG